MPPIPPKRVVKGQAIRADEWNKIVDSLNNRSLNFSEPLKTGIRSLSVYTEAADIAPWSIFGIVAEPQNGVQPVVMTVKGIGHTSHASPFFLFTNGPDEIPSGGWGNAYPINGYTPQRIRCTASTPSVGWPCGVQRGGLGIDASEFGLICLAVEPGSSGDPDYAWVVRAFDAGSTVGVVSSEVSAFDAMTSTLGSGEVTMKVRNSSDALVDAMDPADSVEVMEFPVFSLSEEVLEVGFVLLCTVVAGIGLLGVKLAETAGSGSGTCFIPGINPEDLSTETAPDFLLGAKDNCLVKVAAGQCPEGSSS